MHLYCDNKTAINLTNNLVIHDRTKHVEIDRHFIRKEIDSKELVLPYIKSEDQLAYMFIKGWVFEKNISKLGMFNMYAELDGEC